MLQKRTWHDVFTSVVVDSKLVSSAPGKAGTLSGFTSSGRQGGRRSRIASKYIFQSTSGQEAGLGTFRWIDRHCGWQCPNKAHIAYSRWLTDNCLFLIASMCGRLDWNWCVNIESEFIQASILSIGGVHINTHDITESKAFVLQSFLKETENVIVKSSWDWAHFSLV